MSKQTTGREIKFRAWSTKWKKMVYPDDNELHITIGNDDIHTIWKDSGDEEGVPLMQFTGLKDKNGKEIYEGDIVQDIVVFMKSQIVFTDYANFGMKPINSTMKDLEYEIIDPAWTETSLEVIGNIYENPNLLPCQQPIR